MTDHVDPSLRGLPGDAGAAGSGGQPDGPPLSGRDALSGFGLNALPERGVAPERVLAEIKELRGRDRPTHGGRLFAYVYDPAVPGLDELTASAHALSAHVNGLDPTAFPSLLAMENALVAAVARLLGGGPFTNEDVAPAGDSAFSAPGFPPAGEPDRVPTVVGNVTSGGTESLILAVKAARDARPEVAQPELVVPVSGHAAFAKAAAYLRVRLVPVPVSPQTLRPSPRDVAAAITPATVLVACSAPSYAHGVVDPVGAIAAAAAERGVRCHVDACFGGFVLPFLRRLGEPVPPFDFTVPGVTSISVDLHKYAYCPKGVSILLHRDESLRAPQYFAYADWPGYTMVNPTIASTRSGGPIAAAYATLRHIGVEGYLRLCASTRAAVVGLAQAIGAVSGLRLLTGGPAMPESVAMPESTVVAFTSDDPALDLFVLADELAVRGWHTQPQLRHFELPRSIHLTVTASVAPRVAEFAAALADAVAGARSLGPVTLPPDVVASVGALPPEQITPELVGAVAAGLGLGSLVDAGTAEGGALPPRQAVINTLLDQASMPTRAALVSAFLRLLQRPSW